MKAEQRSKPRPDKYRPRKALPFGAVPADFIRLLRETRPSLGERLMRVAGLLWECRSKRYCHNSGEGLFFPSGLLDRVAGQQKFKAFNSALRLLIVDREHVPGESTRRYRLHPDLELMHERYAQQYCRIDADLVDMVEQDRRVQRTVRRAIAPRDGRGNPVRLWGETGIQPTVQVSLDRLDGLRAHLQQQASSGNLPPTEARNKHRQAELVSRVIKLATTALAGRGIVTIRYTEAMSGRLYAEGLNLQNVNTVIRHAALCGMHDYDVSNCHYSLFAQMAERFGFTCRCIPEYLANKNEMRRRLMQSVGADERAVKQALLALIYGASPYWRDPEAALPEALGLERARAFSADPWITELSREIDQAGRRILQSWNNWNRGLLINEAGKALLPDKDRNARKAQQLAHLVQGAEAIVLHTMLSQVPDMTQIALLQHDGLTAKVRLDRAALEAAVLSGCGYRIVLEEKHLSTRSEQPLPSSTVLPAEHYKTPNAPN
jgi:hypothetical protein